MRAGVVWRQDWLAVGFAALMLLSGTARADAALDWLNRAAAAAKQQNYSGVYVYHHGEHVEVLRVLHRTDATGELEKVEVLDGTPRKFLRVNNDVYCHLPDGKNVRLERNALRRFFPALLPAQPAGLLEYYEAKLGGAERVAGRPCQVVMLEPRDGYRYSYNLWLDKQTGLPLKSRVVNDNGGRGVDVRILRNPDWQGARCRVVSQRSGGQTRPASQPRQTGRGGLGRNPAAGIRAGAGGSAFTAGQAGACHPSGVFRRTLRAVDVRGTALIPRCKTCAACRLRA